MLCACEGLLHTKLGVEIVVPPLFTIILCRFQIFKIFVQVAIKLDINSAQGPVAPTEKFSGPDSHTQELLDLSKINLDHF